MCYLRKVGAVALALLLCVDLAAAPAAARPGADAALPAGDAATFNVMAVEQRLHPQTGDVRIPEAKAVLHLGEQYYFLPAPDARRVLVEAWGNPPSSVENVLGMVFEKGTTVADNVWGAVITYDESGHVSDTDAAHQDYAKVLADLRQSVEQSNESRRQSGYPAMHLIGWAQPPHYDAASHALVWARETSAEGDTQHGLNYDVRLLGRTGVLSLNMVSGIRDLADVQRAAHAFARAASFEPGARYADYDAKTDKTAEYGLAGLVAGGAAMAVASKFGWLGVILAFGKKLFIVIAVGAAAAWRFVRGRFTRKTDAVAELTPDEGTA